MPECFGTFDCMDDYCYFCCPYSFWCESETCKYGCRYCPWEW